MSHINDTPTDAVFRALADPRRRQILDLVKGQPGANLTTLADRFAVTRFAIMKHLRVLEAANLVVRRREGRSTRFYLNAIPIQTLYDRWMSRYDTRWASALTSLKSRLEEDAMIETGLKHVYVLYLRTTAEKLWEAITRPELTRLYYHGTEVESDFQVGSRIDYMHEKDGQRVSALTGEILEVEPGRRLVHTFSFPSNDDAPTTVTYEIEPAKDTVKLTVVHEGFAGRTRTYESTSDGWWPIVNGIKTLLETGEPLSLAS
jgi:uncharacterized protein YndB with AHSA1/START domain